MSVNRGWELSLEARTGVGRQRVEVIAKEARTGVSQQKMGVIAKEARTGGNQQRVGWELSLTPV